MRTCSWQHRWHILTIYVHVWCIYVPYMTVPYGRDTSNLILMVSFTFTVRRHLIRFASAPFASFRLTKFGSVPFALCNRLEAKQNAKFTEGGWNLRSYFDPFVEKVYDLFRRCRRLFVLSNAHARLSMTRFIQKIFAIKSRSCRKPNKCNSFFHPHFLGRDDSDFSTSDC